MIRSKSYNPRRLFRWIIENNFPEGFQVLCYNCNLGRAHCGGVCPHKSDFSLKPKNDYKLVQVLGKPTFIELKNGQPIKRKYKNIQFCLNCGVRFTSQGTHPHFAGFCNSTCQKEYKNREK